MEEHNWFLMKHDDGTTFGPVPFEQLRQWAVDAQISPLDKVSHDEQKWQKAPMLPGLEMDYLIEVGTDQFYGPTTVGAVKEFLDNREITRNTAIINCTTGERIIINDFEPLKEPEVPPTPASTGTREPVRTNIRFSLQQRIRDLEEALMEERLAREGAEQIIDRLEGRIAELGG